MRGEALTSMWVVKVAAPIWDLVLIRGNTVKNISPCLNSTILS